MRRADGTGSEVRLLETIRCRDGILEGLSFHNERLNRTRRHFWEVAEDWDLGALIEVPAAARHGLFKVRVVYGRTLQQVTCEPYRIRPVRRLRLVAAGDLDYEWKFADRSALTDRFQQRGDCDDILLTRDGRIMDSYYANIACRDGDSWYTPEHPLLPGTRRARLLAAGRVQTADIRVADLGTFQEFRLFNAMFGLEDGVVVEEIL